MDRVPADVPPPLAPRDANVDPIPYARVAAPRATSTVAMRVYASMIVVACAGVLGLAVYVRPDTRGYGTHQQLGFGPCAMVITTGYPCPTCGMTTAFAHTVRLQWGKALWAQPSGFLLALATAACAGGSLWTALTGRAPMSPVTRIGPFALAIILLALLFGGWAFKIVIGLIDGSIPATQIRA